MQFHQSKATQMIVYGILMILVAVSLTGISLLSLPFFYEQTSQGKLIAFIIIALSFLLLVLLTTRAFILPCLRQFHKKENLIFVIIIAIILIAIFSLNSANYWAVPEIHTVEICFDAVDEPASVNIEKLVDPNTNRLFSPISFGFSRYPILLESGNCIHGKITLLLSRLNQALMGFRLTVKVQDSPPDGRFFVKINDAPAVINFDQEGESQLGDEIIYNEGFDQGKKLDFPWREYWFMGIKSIGILISACYLAFILFGLTERILSFSPPNDMPPNEK